MRRNRDLATAGAVEPDARKPLRLEPLLRGDYTVRRGLVGRCRPLTDSDCDGFALAVEDVSNGCGHVLRGSPSAA